jgi:hypothetical protein
MKAAKGRKNANIWSLGRERRARGIRKERNIHNPIHHTHFVPTCVCIE